MKVLMAIGLALAGAATPDVPVEVYVTLDPPEIPFHRKAHYSIVAEVTGDIEVTFPEMVDQFGGLAVQDVQRDTKILRRGRKRISVYEELPQAEPAQA